MLTKQRNKEIVTRLQETSSHTQQHCTIDHKVEVKWLNLITTVQCTRFCIYCKLTQGLVVISVSSYYETITSALYLLDAHSTLDSKECSISL